jgi:hypothetical protein
VGEHTERHLVHLVQCSAQLLYLSLTALTPHTHSASHLPFPPFTADPSCLPPPLVPSRLGHVPFLTHLLLQPMHVHAMPPWVGCSSGGGLHCCLTSRLSAGGCHCWACSQGC